MRMRVGPEIRSGRGRRTRDQPPLQCSARRPGGPKRLRGVGGPGPYVFRPARPLPVPWPGRRPGPRRKSQPSNRPRRQRSAPAPGARRIALTATGRGGESVPAVHSLPKAAPSARARGTSARTCTHCQAIQPESAAGDACWSSRNTGRPPGEETIHAAAQKATASATADNSASSCAGADEPCGERRIAPGVAATAGSRRFRRVRKGSGRACGPYCPGSSPEVVAGVAGSSLRVAGIMPSRESQALLSAFSE